MIRVTVEGKVGTGKSSVARVIFEALEAQGIPVTITDQNDSSDILDAEGLKGVEGLTVELKELMVPWSNKKWPD